MVVEGMVLLAGGGTAFEFGPSLPAADLSQLGAYEVTVGLVVIGIGFLLHEVGTHRRALGAVLIGLGVISAAGGGGFLLGLALSISGGGIAMLGRPVPLFRAPHGTGHGPR